MAGTAAPLNRKDLLVNLNHTKKSQRLLTPGGYGFFDPKYRASGIKPEEYAFFKLLWLSITCNAVII